MELEEGRAITLAVVKKRIWYAPWIKKTVGIRFNLFFISLKQPKPNLFHKATIKCLWLRHWQEHGRLGSTWCWQRIYKEKEAIDQFLTKLGGDPLPSSVMTEDAEIYYVDGNFHSIPEGALKTEKYDYRPIVKRPMRRS